MRFKKVTPSTANHQPGDFRVNGRYDIDTKHVLAIYIRQSSLKQKHQRRQSRELQTKDFLERGIEWGWVAENIRLYDDTGQTAVIELAEREQLMLLIDDIKSGHIKTVMVYMVDRMFRSQYLEDAVQFAQVCARNGVKLFTYYHQMYDFTDERDYENFILDAHKAYGAYKSQIIDRMGDMRKRATKAGEYNGRYLGLGYMRNPDNKIAIKPFTPHGDVIRGLFEAYRQSGFNMYATSKLVCGNHVFPPIPHELLSFFKYKSKPEPDGWYGLSYGGLRSILSNPIYIGWWYTEEADTEGKPIYLKEHHEAVISDELFWLCFEYASTVTVDGNATDRAKRYTQLHTGDTGALLKNIITGEGKDEYVFLDHANSGGTQWRYRIVKGSDIANRYSLGQISMSVIEDAVVKTLLELMNQEERFTDYAQHVKTITAQEKKDREHKEERVKAINHTLAISLQNMMKVEMSQEDVDEMNRVRSGLKAEKAGLIVELATPSDTEKVMKILSSYALLKKMYTRWLEGKLKQENKRALINTLVRRVTLAKLSAHFYRLTCYWQFSDTPSVLGIWYATGDTPRWSEEELDILRTYWSDPSLKERLPRRSWDGMHQRAYNLKITDSYSSRWRTFENGLTAQDRAAIARYSIEVGPLTQKETMLMDWTNSDIGDEHLMPAPAWSSDGSTLYVIASYHGASRLFAIASEGAGTQPATLTPGGIHARDFSVDAAKGRLALLIGDPTRPQEIYVRSTAPSDEVRRLTGFNDTLFNELELASPEYMSYKGADGWDMDGWILKPRDFDPAQKYPLIVEIHGGPQTQYGYGFFHEMQMLVAQGYVVLYTNPRGSCGYGYEFALAVRGAWGEKDSIDIMNGLDTLLSRGYIDEQRIGVTGGSYGGFMTNWLVGHYDRFRAAVTDRCVSNMATMFGASDIGWDLADDNLDTTPWEDLAKYMHMSPLNYVKNIHTPLLILHSEQDLRCNIEQAEQLFAALKYMGRDVLFVRFEGQSHGLSRGGHPKLRLERLQHIKNWFEKYL